MSDKLKDLPTDEEGNASPKEAQILNTLFKKKEEVGSEMYSEFKEVAVASLIFAILSLPFVGGLIQSVCPSAGNMFVLLIVKTIVFFILYYIVVRTYLRPEKKGKK